MFVTKHRQKNYIAMTKSHAEASLKFKASALPGNDSWQRSVPDVKLFTRNLA